MDLPTLSQAVRTRESWPFSESGVSCDTEEATIPSCRGSHPMAFELQGHREGVACPEKGLLALLSSEPRCAVSRLCPSRPWPQPQRCAPAPPLLLGTLSALGEITRSRKLSLSPRLQGVEPLLLGGPADPEPVGCSSCLLGLEGDPAFPRP